ncbi:MAG: BON domain-containing protein [Bryobacterales bacterium]|nr:BON domain-containing protein [Bryobacterales bacterium]
MRLLCLLFVLAASLLSAEGPAKTPAKKAVAANARQTPSLSDADLEKAIRARFAASRISADNFQVRVQSGVAILEGATNVIQRKGTATRLAKLAGARTVRNDIRISEAARQKAAQQLTGIRRAAVKTEQ